MLLHNKRNLHVIKCRLCDARTEPTRAIRAGRLVVFRPRSRGLRLLGRAGRLAVCPRPVVFARHLVAVARFLVEQRTLLRHPAGTSGRAWGGDLG
jgi:hypothetical protein